MEKSTKKITSFVDLMKKLQLLIFKDKCEDIFRDLLNNLDNDSDDEQESTTYENFLRVKL